MVSLTLPPTTALEGTLRVPGSKSISNRVLLLAALARGTTAIEHLLESEDTVALRSALQSLGVPISSDGGAWFVTGRGGPLVNAPMQRQLDLGLAGTALRPLAAALTLGAGEFVLDGTARMRERPVAPLVDALRTLGANISYLGNDGFPPIKVSGTGLRGGMVRMRGDLSSQFLTSLLMAAPLADGPVTVEIDGEQVSKPYLAITTALMAEFGHNVAHEGYRRFSVSPGLYRSPGRFAVEPDASSATYFLAAGAIRGRGLTIDGIGRASLQGDVAFVDVLRAMGATVEMEDTRITVRPGGLRGFDRDLNAIPDAAMTAAVLALFADGETTIRNVYNWRVKETDRIVAMATELRKLGAHVVEGRDFLKIIPGERIHSAVIDTYGDHRMAMCFSLASLGGVPVTINDPGCVSKTFPTYFEVFNDSRVG